jgi:peptide/histidine transporter 3/4
MLPPSGSVQETAALLHPHLPPTLLPRRNVLRTVCSVILLLQAVDQLSFYGISQGLKNFMEDRLGYSKVTSSSIRSTWTSFCNIMPLLGAFIGDEILGRYRSIAFFAFWYVVACGLLTLCAVPSLLENHVSIANILFLISLFGGIAIGHGCFGPNIIVFGADQFHVTQEAEKKRFFSHFYAAMNMGSSVSYGYLSYLSVNGMGDLIPPSYGYVTTFAFCTLLLLLTTTLFIAYGPRCF